MMATVASEIDSNSPRLSMTIEVQNVLQEIVHPSLEGLREQITNCINTDMIDEALIFLRYEKCLASLQSAIDEASVVDSPLDLKLRSEGLGDVVVAYLDDECEYSNMATVK